MVCGGYVKVLLLENISGIAAELFSERGFEVETAAGALDEAALADRIGDVAVLGVRSKTAITRAVIEKASNLIAVGAFCIGVDRIDRAACGEHGVAVFNDPHSNSRSVAEMALGEIIMLARGIFARSMEIHRGSWNKTARDSHEVRGLTLGIIGYGKIGSQLSDLAEAMGMRVVFHDVAEVLARGNAKRASLPDLLATADIVTIHVDGRSQNIGMFGAEQFRRMKRGALFLNLARGVVVDHQALAEALRGGHLGGAAIDVYPEEPEANGPFRTPLQGIPNVILTPHIGGSTEQAQEHIGRFVSTRLIDYTRTGNTLMSVNFPNCHLDIAPGTHRLTHLHRNMPGMLLHINEVLAARNINIERQVLDTRGDLGYAIYDVNSTVSDDLVRLLERVPHTIRVRSLDLQAARSTSGN
jgi:D-3-phosphoglycerate dehydrogenase